MRIQVLNSPVRVVGDVNVEGLECVKVELGEPDEWGKRAAKCRLLKVV